jgi:hypothetical protein
LRDEIQMIDLRLRESFGEPWPAPTEKPWIIPGGRPRRQNSWWTGKTASQLAVLAVLAVILVLAIARLF